MKNAKVVLKKGKEVIFYNRHQWIFSGAVESFPYSFEDGSIAPVSSASGEFLGYAYFRLDNSLSGRIVSFGKADPWQTISSHIDRAIILRKTLIDQKQTNAFRLVNGEGDNLPGLVIDQYGEYLVLQSSTLGMDKIKPYVLDHLVKTGRWRGIFEKSTSSSRQLEGLDPIIDTLWGEKEDDLFIVENGVRFRVNWREGQKTGFFLDQREVRQLVRSLSKGKKVFNGFCYTGGFSVYSLLGGAQKVDSLDASATALDMAKENFALNDLPLTRGQFIEADAFHFLQQDPLQYDLIILDPPAFVKHKKDVEQGSKGYQQINWEALRKMPKNSLLLTCSCSQAIDDAQFKTILFESAMRARRDVQIVKEAFHSPDHPISLFHPEGRYLKSILLYVS